MPIIKSAKKRVRTAEKAAIRNSKVKRALKTAVKAFRSSVAGTNKDAAANQSKAQSAIDTAAKKGLIHKNKAARQKAQLARVAKAAGTAAPTAAKKVKSPVAAPAKKTVAAKKPTTTKAAPAKKPSAAAKKPAAKK